MNDKAKLRGMKIRTFNYAMIAVACVLYAFLLYLTVQVFSRYELMVDATDAYIHCEHAATMVAVGSDDLTEAVRMYVVTEDPAWAEAYFEEANVERTRDQGLEMLEEYHRDDENHEYLETALGYSNDLMRQEIHAMALIARAGGADPEDLPREIREARLSEADLALDREGALAAARDLVFGSSYQYAKELIGNNVQRSLDSTLDALREQHTASTEDLHTAIRRQRLCITALFIMNVVVFFFITALIIRPLQIYIKNIGDNKTLEIIGSYEFKYLAITYNSIYEINSANEIMLRHQAERDALTGIMNRGSFDKLKQSLRGFSVPVTLMLIDVDRFKLINDGYGHAAGDQVLKTVAKLLSDSFRSTDFVARIGGDEFCVVITEVSDQLCSTVERKVDEINALLRQKPGGIPEASLSAGVATSQEGFDDGLYRRADTALYASKEAGRGRCSFYGKRAEDADHPYREEEK